MVKVRMASAALNGLLLILTLMLLTACEKDCEKVMKYDSSHHPHIITECKYK